MCQRYAKGVSATLTKGVCKLSFYYFLAILHIKFYLFFRFTKYEGSQVHTNLIDQTVATAPRAPISSKARTASALFY